MADNIIEGVYIDRLTVKLDGDRDTLFAIQQALSYFAKDYKFMPLFKRGIWDGKVYLFKVTNCLLPSGLLGMLRGLQERLGFELVLAPGPFSEVTPFDTAFFLERIAGLSQFEIMEHQLGSVEEVLTHNRRLVLSPTSSGKSLIQYLCARYVIEKHKKRVLIIVPNKSLVVQMREDFTEYSTDGWGGEKDIHAIYAEQEIWTGHDVVVSTYQTAVKLSPEWYEQFGAIFIDEAHGATSKSVTTILEATKHMLYHAGFTGTLNGTYMHEMEMRARFGDVTKLVTTKELMDMGIVAKLEIHALHLNHNEEAAKLAAKWKYPDEVDYLIASENRNVFVANLASTMSEKNVMVLFHRTEHGHTLKKLIESRIEGTGKTLLYVDGNISIEARKPMRAFMEANEGCILLASYGTSSVGLSIKNIHFMVLAHPFRDRIRVLQTIGRILRLSPGKLLAVVVDIGDYLAGKRKTNNHTYDHFLERLELYQNEGFDCEVITIPEHV